ncbi:hypothetical protein BDW42DRAFT_48518 [Aspergillus taichungensis]|uniref:Uncharacterized protein n=1 Tax=Aspergillus taichungensis TaxID=482145 RepID=A0A2J5I2W6_9EURO|nr:hypothetical protein BDW42DRAFT_48518 [Aspergillus taichungensis]
MDLALFFSSPVLYAQITHSLYGVRLIRSKPKVEVQFELDILACCTEGRQSLAKDGKIVDLAGFLSLLMLLRWFRIDLPRGCAGARLSVLFAVRGISYAILFRRRSRSWVVG